LAVAHQQQQQQQAAAAVVLAGEEQELRQHCCGSSLSPGPLAGPAGGVQRTLENSRGLRSLTIAIALELKQRTPCLGGVTAAADSDTGSDRGRAARSNVDGHEATAAAATTATGAPPLAFSWLSDQPPRLGSSLADRRKQRAAANNSSNSSRGRDRCTWPFLPEAAVRAGLSRSSSRWR
jgi:hypothetical protein